ncbi:MAG: hypothetical protein JOZ19_16015 [Rubrobacter sp.]|nr:hypothetical protein [Rubrobacter sp.]
MVRSVRTSSHRGSQYVGENGRSLSEHIDVGTVVADKSTFTVALVRLLISLTV